MATAIEIFEFLPPDMKYQLWLDAMEQGDWKNAMGKMVNDLIPRMNEDRSKIEQEISRIRWSLMPVNELKGTGFRTFSGGVPANWTAQGAGGTYTQQTNRTGGNPANYAVRIAAPAGNAVQLTQAIELTPGQKYVLSGFARVVSGSGFPTLKITWTSATVTAPGAVNLPGGSVFYAFPQQGIDEFFFQLPDDATAATIEIGASAASTTVEFCELQLGRGHIREPLRWYPHVSDLASGTNALLDGTNHTDTTNSAVTRGDIIIGNSTPAWDDLAIGSAGHVLTSDGTDPAWKIADAIAQAGSTQQITSQTALQNDNALSLAIGANETWTYVVDAEYTATLLTTGVKVGVTVPAGATLVLKVAAINGAGGTAPTSGRSHFGTTNASGTAIDFTTANLAVDGSLYVYATIEVVNGANAGTVQWQFAQSTSSGTAVVRSVGGKMLGIRKKA